MTAKSDASVLLRGLASAPLDSESARELVQPRISLLARVCVVFGLPRLLTVELKQRAAGRS